MAEKQITVLESIIEEVSLELYQKLWNALPSEDQTEESSRAVGLNSKETTLFVIQRFMDKFNAAAEELKSRPDEQ